MKEAGAHLDEELVLVLALEGAKADVLEAGGLWGVVGWVVGWLVGWVGGWDRSERQTRRPKGPACAVRCS